MRLSSLAPLMLVGMFALLVGPAPMMAETPSAEDLILLAPVISSADPTRKSIEFSMTLMGEDSVALGFHAYYRAPDQFSLLITDGADGVPLAFGTDRKIMFYDPVRPVVICGSNTDLYFSITPDESHRHLRIGFLMSHDGSQPSQLLLDLKSIFDKATADDQVIKTGNGTYRLTRGSEQGIKFIASFDLAQRCPYTRFEYWAKDSNGPSLCIDKIIVDGPIPEEAFQFPAREVLSKTINVQDWPDGKPWDDLAALGFWIRAGYVRMAAHYPELRDRCKVFGVPLIDWDNVRANDEKYACALREAIKLECPKP